MSAPTWNVELSFFAACGPVLELLLGNPLDFAQVQLAGSKQGQLIHPDKPVLCGG